MIPDWFGNLLEIAKGGRGTYTTGEGHFRVELPAVHALRAYAGGYYSLVLSLSAVCSMPWCSTSL